MSFTQYPDFLIDCDELSAYELAASLVVARKTIGWGKKEDGISLSQFVKILKLSKPTVIKIIDLLISKDVITKTATTRKDGGQSFNIYSFTDRIINAANQLRMNEKEAYPSKGDLHPPVKEIDRGSKGDLQGPVKEIDTQDKANTKQTKQDKSIKDRSEAEAPLSIEIEDHELGAMSREQLEKYCAYRKSLKKKLPMSHRALIAIVSEFNKLPAHITIDEAIEHCKDEERRWKGFKAQWVARDLSTDNPDYLPEYRKAAISAGMGDAEATQLFAKMVSHYRSRGIQIVNWADQWVTWVNNECIKDVHNDKSVYNKSKPLSKHNGFDQRDYHSGISEEGRF